MLFRQKPVVIEAWQVSELLRLASESFRQLPETIRGSYETGDVVFGTDAIHVKTLEGDMTGSMGDWIIRGVQGELYPIKDSIFRETYTPETYGR